MGLDNRIRVLIADDSPTALRSVCEYLEFAGGFEVVCTTCDGMNAVQLASRHNPDLALLDLSMPRLNGLEAAKQLRRAFPDPAGNHLFRSSVAFRLAMSANDMGRTVFCPKVSFRMYCSMKSGVCFRIELRKSPLLANRSAQSIWN